MRPLTNAKSLKLEYTKVSGWGPICVFGSATMVRMGAERIRITVVRGLVGYRMPNARIMT